VRREGWPVPDTVSGPGTRPTPSDPISSYEDRGVAAGPGECHRVLGGAVEVSARGLWTGQVHEQVHNAGQPARPEASPELEWV
jgi:hypothetical protein